MPEGLGLVRADHLAVRVPDYTATIAFYTGVLGLELRQEWTLPDVLPGARFAYLALGEFQIEIIAEGSFTPAPPTDDVAAHLGRGGWIHLCLRVENLDHTVAALKARGRGVPGRAVRGRAHRPAAGHDQGQLRQRRGAGSGRRLSQLRRRPGGGQAGTTAE